MPVGVRCPTCETTFIPTATSADCPTCARTAPRPRPADPLVGRTISGFLLMVRLGSGAMAAVYEARPLTGGAHVAIKMLTSEAAKDEETVTRFRREADLVRTLEHPHLVTVGCNGTENGVHWMALELVAGTTLEAEIDRRGRLPWQEAVSVVLPIGEALAYLGARGVLHRDVKPANILLGADGIAKLTDLGFAKSVLPHADEEASELTVSGMAMGSPAYMATEQVLDAKAVTHLADVYGLGATLYHAVTGATPFSGRNGYEVKENVVKENVVKEDPPAPRTLVSDLPIGLAAFLMWALEKDPARRPRDAATFVRELTAVAASPDVVPASAGQQRRSRSGALIPLLVAAGVLAAAAGWWWLRQR